LKKDNLESQATGLRKDGKGSREGNWVKGQDEAEESLHPDLNHGPPQGKHWDYHGPGFDKGTRLYPDGTWEHK